jgi:hypothetical protein
MSSLIDALPGQAQKDSLLDGFNAAISPDVLGLDALNTLDVDTVADSFVIDAMPGFHAEMLPPLPPGLTKAGLLQRVSEPLAQIKSIHAASLIEEIKRGVMAPLPKPNFRISEAASQITGAIVPVFKNPTFDFPAGSFGQELFDLSGLEAPLTQLAQAGAATPLRLLDVLL